MPTNDFIGFASAGSANIMSQVDYAAAAEQTDGVQPGPASSALANKIWRQGTNMAAALGRFILQRGYNALDNGDIASLTTSLTGALAEVGTWTPGLGGSTDNGGFTYTTQTGYYARAGHLVGIIGIVAVSACTAAPAGILLINGLPYVSNALSRTVTINAWGNGMVSNSLRKCVGFYAGVGTTQLAGRIYRNTSDNYVDAYPDMNWSSNTYTERYVQYSVGSISGEIHFGGVYFTDDN